MTGKVGSFCLCACVVLLSVRAFGSERGRSPSVPLFINEVMASNQHTVADPQGQFDDWIEIYNAGTDPIDMGNMYLSDDPAQPRMWRIPGPANRPPADDPTSTTIQPQGFLVIWLDGQTGDLGLHANFNLNAEGDAVYLFATDGMTLIDGFAFGPQSTDVSFGRVPDGGATLRYLGVPTPRAPNNGGYLGEVGPLRFSHERGFYDAPFDLKIACVDSDAMIVYTLDGTPPEDTSPVYKGPMRIATTMCLRAMAIRPGLKPSAIYTRTYVLGAAAAVRSLPIVSLVGDPQNTFYEPNGVMAIVDGAYSGGVWVSTDAGSYNNVLNRDLERPVSAEWLFADDPADCFQVDCGLRVHGSDYMRPRYVRQNGLWSGSGKFSLRLYFRSEYGQSRLKYPLFEDSSVDQFKHIVLRAGHNDETNPFIKDELVRRLYKDMGNVEATGTFANLFIDGQYKGYYNPTEHISEDACQQWFGSDLPWDVMTMSGIRDGDTRSWDAMVNFALTHDLSFADNYQYMASKLDIPSFIDYLIVRLWPNDWDWPQNNWAAAAERSDAGIWRFFVWDAEGTFESGQINNIRFTELNSQDNANGQLYRALKASPDFRRLFGDRLYKHFYNGGALTAGNVQRRFNELRSQLTGVIGNMDTYIINSWVPNRLPIFLNACVSENVYTFGGPAFTVNGAYQWGGHAAVGDILTIIPPAGTIALYYPPGGTEPTGSAARPIRATVTLMPRDAPKRFLIPTGSDVGDWRNGRGYNDSAWIAAGGLPGGIGYERAPSGGLQPYIATDIGARMYGVNSSCYIRIPFSIFGDSSTMTNLTLNVQYDDGFVAYLNGIEIARRNLAAPPVWNSVASADRSDAEAAVFEAIDISAFTVYLQSSNVLAIQGLNASATSEDFLIAAELTVTQTLTGQGVPAGMAYCTGPIQLTKSTRIQARALKGNTLSAMSDAIFAVGPVAESLRISEIMYHPADTGSPDDPNCEYIELTNIGAETINLNRARFTKGVDFTLPDFDLAPHGYCLIVRDRAVFEATYGADLPIVGQYRKNLSNAGEQIELCDAAGKVIQSFTYSDDWFGITDGGGFSLTARHPDAADPNLWNRKEAWRPSAASGGSPGSDDSGVVPELGSVVINEVMADPAPPGSDGDWIELYNTTSRPISVAGWLLSDDSDDLAKYVIARGTTIAPGSFLVLTEGRHFGNPSDPGCLVPFALSHNGETVHLHSGIAGVPSGYSEQASFGASDPGVSFVRYPTGTGEFALVAASGATPGQANVYPQVGPVVINEIMYHPNGSQDVQYVELVNISRTQVTLYDSTRGVPWRFFDASTTAGVDLVLPSDPPITLAPSQFLLLVKDHAAFVAKYGAPTWAQIAEWTFGRLSDAGGQLVLGKPGDLDKGVRQWVTVDSVAFSDGSHPGGFLSNVDPWPSQADGQGRSLVRTRAGGYGSDPNNWSAEVPSPGAGTRLVLTP